MTIRSCGPALLVSALLLCGCGGKSDGKLRVGVLDTAQILSEMPKYKDLQANLTREQAEFQTQLSKEGQGLTEDRAKKLQADVLKRRSEWQKRVNQTIQGAIVDIKELTQQVAQEKNLDIVVVSTPFNRSVHYHAGQDVTLDVRLKLKRN